MAIYELTNTGIQALAETTFAASRIKERADLQRVLREHVEVICPDTLVIAEEFGEWEDANRRIDLLGVDREGNLVVIELKRTETGGHMELQALRYAAMVSAMTFDRAVDLYRRMLQAAGDKSDAEAKLREFLGWEDAETDVDDVFAQRVRVILASAEFGRELTTTVLWLNEQGLDIRCVRMRPYTDGTKVLLDVQQVIPLPEAEQYQVQLREKAQKERSARQASDRDYSKFDVASNGQKRTRLSKRDTIYAVLRGLADQGITPQQIMAGAPSRGDRLFQRIPGVYSDSEAAIAAATNAAAAQGRAFDPRRYYTDVDELFIGDGETYLLTNQWGGEIEHWLTGLLASFPNCTVTFSKCE